MLVVTTNIHARHLYKGLGFKQLGTITGAFWLVSSLYKDICPCYIIL